MSRLSALQVIVSRSHTSCPAQPSPLTPDTLVGACVEDMQDGLPLGSPPVHPQFILGALFLRPDREKVHTVVGQYRRQTAGAARIRRLPCKPSSRTTVACGCGGSWQSS